MVDFTSFTPPTLQTLFFALVRASETLVFLLAKRLECGPLERGLVRPFLVVFLNGRGQPRESTQPLVFRTTPTSRLVESLSQQSFFDPSYQKATVLCGCHKKEEEKKRGASVIVVRRHHRLNVKVYTGYNKR